MTKLFIYSIVLFLSLAGKTQNVGIGTNTPLEKLDVIGNIRSGGLRIPAAGSIDLGVGIQNKEPNAGRIGYALFTSNTLDIIGAGTAPDNRRIRFWAEDVTEFTGKGHFFFPVGIGVAPVAGQSLTLAGSNSIQLGLRNTNAIGNDVRSGLAFGGNNYTTGIIQTIGSANNIARMGFFTGYSFEGGISNLAERLTILNDGRVGIGRISPTAQLEVGSSNNKDWIRIVSDNVEVLKINSSGFKFDQTKSTYVGAALVNSNQDGLGKWGYTVLGSEMTKSSEQPIAHGVSTRINFDTRVFDHNNVIAFDDPQLEIGNTTTDVFKMIHRGIALIEFEVNWAGSPGGLGGGGLRNGATQILRNGTVVRTIPNSTNNHRDRCYISVNEGDIITINGYHEHCIDPPPVCLTGIARTISNARVTVINL
jgi:hypothetical protein